jgi:hypothetical protein
MTLDVGKWIDALKLPARYFLALLVAGVFLLFGPTSWLSQFGIAELRTRYRPFIGVGTLLCATMLLASVFAWISKRMTWKINERRLIKSLCSLSADEKRVLREYASGETQTDYFPVGDGVIGGLEAKKILYRSSAISVRLQFPYNIQPWALKHLAGHPELLE